ncbi:MULTISPECIES: energy-coupling factor ABC transporter permease [Thermomonospora]|uniref:Cobalamin (Vitamin B12) biosynthesis CbiM protein n=1 Tax=Thermomonospora curvata (strain ATCC 19995 / DSM 43183 / JCM 3096 / KCTC 9072 / NBRC 15933 / NCIMB 10081 / Henssen B9) TaxID=471852 RepID=D1A9Z7_THECD|nr:MULTISPECIES: energy-coupling factor ABC transporter permease [Thermomonospora]ACY96933.1 cobalamin (vitamin B12) biosynthesis CbiM protein [Thermomonospora curvata DSM 43183]PKK15212.1 MAG: cobalamin biosynthesis protein CbiM [Thermomonospora sp. CIF 1]
MHVPDGFFNAPVSIGAGVVAAAGIGLCLRGARRELDERTAPLAGLSAAFVFAAQMINFPVAAGTSGHLMGGALAAILVGPYTGVLCISVVLLVQMLFADGGVTAYGINVTLMALTGVLVGYGVFKAVTALLPGGLAHSRAGLTAASFLGALASVPASALVFVALFALGGTADLPLGAVLGAMLGVHLLIGIGEGVITAITVGTVAAVRPDLVYGLRGRPASPLEIRTPRSVEV